MHIIGENAAELVHIGLMVLRTGRHDRRFIDSVFNYPSLGDAYKYAAYDGLGAIQRRASRSRAGPSARQPQARGGPEMAPHCHERRPAHPAG